jgi:hypothetical protein
MKLKTLCIRGLRAICLALGAATLLAAFDQPDRFNFALQRVLAKLLSVFSVSQFVSLQLVNLTTSYGVRYSGATSLSPIDVPLDVCHTRQRGCFAPRR